MTDLKTQMERYAELVIRGGVNLQPGQPVFIGAGASPVSIECADFVRLLAEKAYDAGARRVYVQFEDQQLRRMTLERAEEESLTEYSASLAKWFEEIAEQNGVFISVYTPDPDLLKGIDPKRTTGFQQAQVKALSGFSRYTTNTEVSWCVVSVPTAAWANRLFPHLAEEKRMGELWRYILQATRADQPDPLGAWKEHLSKLGERTERLNQLQFKSLHYRAPGTELVVELPEQHLWVSCAGTANAKGVPFAPNIPSEEVFTMPKRDGVNGTVRSTLPLNYNGALIDNFSLRFEDGKIVDFSAETGFEALKGLIETDEGAARLGEVALVPVNSPICQTGLLFYNTLFDENASCHFAIGRAYPMTLKGGTSMSKEELAEHGANHSLTHVDFMIGSPELDIDGETATGEIIPVFRKGCWAL